MGRYKRYTSEIEKKAAKKKWNHEYYERNKETIDRQAKERYHRKMDARVSKVLREDNI